MKKMTAILTAVVCAGSMSASAALLVGFENWSVNNPNGGSGVINAATSTATGFSGDSITATDNWGRSASGANTDGTFGTLAGADTGTQFHAGLALNNGAEGSYDFTISNNSGSSYALDYFRFDTGTWRPGAATKWTVSILSGGDLTAQTVDTGDASNITGGVVDWENWDVGLGSITDGNVLADGESATFRLAMTDGGTDTHHMYIDSIAISGNVVPEPATLGLVAAFGGGVLFIRRRLML